MEPLVQRVRWPVPQGDAGQLGSGPALGPLALLREIDYGY